MRRALSAIAALLLFLPDAHAAAKQGRMGPAPKQIAAASAPVLRANSTTPAQVVAAMEETLEADFAAMRAWNESGQVPARIGVVRELPSSVAVRGIATASLAPWRWRGTVHVEGAGRTRLQLRDVTLPPSAKLWVYGDGDAVSFNASNVVDGELWTPSIWGGAITLEVESPGGGSFTIARVADIRDDIATNGTECFQSVACQAQSIRDSATAIARYEVPSTPGFVSLCTGGLIIDRKESFDPYFLTARHCVSKASEAAAAEVFWDYRPASCGAISPPLFSVPRTNGASILATSASTDMTLLRLSSVPGTRYYLGWDPKVLQAGQLLRRVSHPGGSPQVYSTTTVDGFQDACTALPRSHYIYSNRLTGGTSGGSSGGPVFIDDGIIVGQLLGKCGSELSNDCSLNNYIVDGSLRQSWPLLEPILDPQVSTCTACVPNNQTACLLGGRFKVTMPTWRDTFANLSGKGSLVKYADNLPEVHPEFGPMSESAFFSMYAHGPKSIEALVRMIKGQNINNKYWVFLMGFTGAEYTIEIQDTQTCRTWKRTVPVGATNVIKDFEAFPFN